MHIIKDLTTLFNEVIKGLEESTDYLIENLKDWSGEYTMRRSLTRSLKNILIDKGKLGKIKLVYEELGAMYYNKKRRLRKKTEKRTE